jgi:hypothetical protein
MRTMSALRLLPQTNLRLARRPRPPSDYFPLHSSPCRFHTHRQHRTRVLNRLFRCIDWGLHQRALHCISRDFFSATSRRIQKFFVVVYEAFGDGWAGCLPSSQHALQVSMTVWAHDGVPDLQSIIGHTKRFSRSVPGGFLGPGLICLFHYDQRSLFHGMAEMIGSTGSYEAPMFIASCSFPFLSSIFEMGGLKAT